MIKMDKKEYKEELLKFRFKYIKEMDNSMKVAISIRDNDDAKDKDKNEAMKYIARSLGGLTPETVTKSTAQVATFSKEQLKMPKVSKEVQDRLDGFLEGH